MPLDLATEADGDLAIVGGGLKVATDLERDRGLMTTRVLTIRGELANMPEMGVPDEVIGRKLDGNARTELEQAVLEALMIDGSLVATKPTVRVVIINQDRAVAFIQSNRVYQSSPGKMVVISDYWHMKQSPMTLLNGAEG